MTRKCYLVTWEIDIWAHDAKDAAEQALVIQRDKMSTATCFQVIEPNTGETVEIDLNED